MTDPETKEAKLLRMLQLANGGLVSMELIAAALWGDRELRPAREKTIRVHASHLRRAGHCIVQHHPDRVAGYALCV
jgi:DNA-binding response OmpR family regulator